MQHGTLQFIGVRTTSDEDRVADLQYVVAATRSIGCHMTEYEVELDKSTIPVGTADNVSHAIRADLAGRGINVRYSVISHPEFLKEATALENFMRPERVMVRAKDERAIVLLRALFASSVHDRDGLPVMSLRTPHSVSTPPTRCSPHESAS